LYDFGSVGSTGTSGTVPKFTGVISAAFKLVLIRISEVAFGAPCEALIFNGWKTPSLKP
jgi:hypothetical protein